MGGQKRSLHLVARTLETNYQPAAVGPRTFIKTTMEEKIGASTRDGKRKHRYPKELAPLSVPPVTSTIGQELTQLRRDAGWQIWLDGDGSFVPTSVYRMQQSQ